MAEAGDLPDFWALSLTGSFIIPQRPGPESGVLAATQTAYGTELERRRCCPGKMWGNLWGDLQ